MHGNTPFQPYLTSTKTFGESRLVTVHKADQPVCNAIETQEFACARWATKAPGVSGVLLGITATLTVKNASAMLLVL